MSKDDDIPLWKRWLAATIMWIVGYSGYLGYLAIFGDPDEPIITASRLGTFTAGLIVVPALHIIAVADRKKK